MRKLTASLLLTLTSVSTLVLAQTAPPAAPPLPVVVKKLAEGVYASINPDGGKAGSNAGFVVGEDSVLVVDTQVNADAAKQLLAEIRKVTSLPIRFVVNTHYHLDHTGGNAVFAEAGAALLAQRNVRPWIRTESLKFFGPTPTPEQKARVDAIALPQVTYGDGIDIYLGSRVVMVRTMPGHTGGDSAVFIPDANVIFGGDLIWNQHLPNMIDASSGPWVNTLEMALSHHPNTTFVPGHGDVATAADVKAFHDYLVDLRTAITQARAAGKSGDDLTKAVTDQLMPKYGKWGFQRFMPLNIAQTAAELAGTKKIPQPETAALVRERVKPETLSPQFLPFAKDALIALEVMYDRRYDSDTQYETTKSEAHKQVLKAGSEARPILGDQTTALDLERYYRAIETLHTAWSMDQRSVRNNEQARSLGVAALPPLTSEGMKQDVEAWRDALKSLLRQ